jgi:putative methyltransferase (TIGR04325 family)
VARGRGEWEYLPRGWPVGVTRGWDDKSILDAQLERWPEYLESVRAPSALRLSSRSRITSTEGDYDAHNTAMTFAYVLSLASRNRDRLSFLDWGGGLGQYAVLARSLVPSLDLEYHCRDLKYLASGGRTLLPNDSFYDSDEQALARTYDLVMASSSLQYIRDWRDELGRLAAVTGGYLYVTRQPFLVRTSSFVVMQRPHRHGYKTEYPGWFLNRDEFLKAADGFGLHLRREFLIAERPFVPGAPEQAEYRGFLFEPTGRTER